MSKRILRVALTGLAAGIVTAAHGASVSVPSYQTSSQWFADGQSQVTEKMAQERNDVKAKNVVLFVGDGMGI